MLKEMKSVYSLVQIVSIIFSSYELWLSLVERLIWDQEVMGSSPVNPVNLHYKQRGLLMKFEHIKLRCKRFCVKCNEETCPVIKEMEKKKKKCPNRRAIIKNDVIGNSGR